MQTLNNLLWTFLILNFPVPGETLGWSNNNNCRADGQKLLSLLNLACSTAQNTNSTARDACYGCFSRFSTMQQGQVQQQLVALSLCANMYFVGTSYEACGTRLMTLMNGGSQVYPIFSPCSTAYCEFIRCLRMTNSNNLIIQCAAEVIESYAVDITLDDDNVWYYTNVTSCILAKTRCSSFNPITGDVQLPGVVLVNNGKYRTGVPISNSLQLSNDATVRILSFPGSTNLASPFCSDKSSVVQTKWQNNEC